MTEAIRKLLGDQAEDLLTHRCKVDKKSLVLPGPDFVDRVWSMSERTTPVLRNMQTMFSHGRLAGSGYLSILPVDQGVEHSAGSAFAPNPIYFDPENIVKLALEGGCNAVASTAGVLGAVARKYAHKIPFIVKLFETGAVAVGATIYFGSEQSRRQIVEISDAFRYAHELGLVTIVWAYLRNEVFHTKDTDYHLAADLTGQANYLSVTLEADIVKQKQPVCNYGFKNIVNYGKYHEKMYTDLSSEHPIDLTRYQVLNCFMGRAGLINSGGASKGKDDLARAVRTAVINKRAGGMGLISGRKAFQRPMKEGVELLHTIQDVYLSTDIDIA
jgi:class I fructose-bisphosphate aldolase